MFEIFHPQGNAGFKASLALMHVTSFILRSSKLEWQEKEPIICSGVYFQHRWNVSHTDPHTCIHINTCTYKHMHTPMYREWKRSLNSFTSVTKKKMPANVITRWLEGWVSQTHEVEINDNTILDVFFSVRGPNRTPWEELKSFKFANYVLLNLKLSLLSIWISAPDFY